MRINPTDVDHKVLAVPVPTNQLPVKPISFDVNSERNQQCTRRNDAAFVSGLIGPVAQIFPGSHFAGVTRNPFCEIILHLVAHGDLRQASR